MSPSFAFYPNKQITTGEGGMVVTDDAVLADTMRSLRNQGRDADGTWLRHVRLGYNYRLDELSAAVGVAQLERLEELRSGRARVVAAYERGLGGCDWATLPRAGPGEIVDWFVYVIRLHRELDRDRIIDSAGRARAFQLVRISRRSTCSRSTERRSASAPATSRSPNGLRHPRSPCRSRPAFRMRTSNTSPTRFAR